MALKRMYMIVSIIVSKRLWGYGLLCVSALSEAAVLSFLPVITQGALGPLNDRIYGTFFSLLIMTAGLLSLFGYRVEGNVNLKGDQLVLKATHSYAYSVRLYPTSRWRVRRFWEEGREVRADAGWDKLRISFANEAEKELCMSSWTARKVA